MDQDEKYLVAFCDVLGFSSVRNIDAVNLLIDKYKKLLNIASIPTTFKIVKPEDSVFNTPTPQKIIDWGNDADLHAPKFLRFSDTIVFYENNHDVASTLFFFKNLSVLIWFSLTSGVPLRIGVAYGYCKIDCDNNFVIGPAATDAHAVEVEQNWIGGALHPSCWLHPFISPDYIKRGNLPLVPFFVPYKSLNNNYLDVAIDWLRYYSAVTPRSIEEVLMDGNWSKDNIRTRYFHEIDMPHVLREFDKAKKLFCAETENDVRVKWDNTTLFCTSMPMLYKSMMTDMVMPGIINSAWTTSELLQYINYIRKRPSILHSYEMTLNL